MEIITPFHAMHLTLKLQVYTEDYKRLVAAYASSNIKVFPYQIAAAQFALSSAYKKGVILCDEGALGKSYEALLVISQMWHEGKKKILVVLPTPLLFQWIKIVDEDFSIPYEVIANDDSFNSFKEELDNPFNGEAIIITTYDYAAKKSEYIKQVKWDVTMFDEAHNLRKDTIKNTAIKEAVKDSYKLLLTATPMQNDIRDLYNLINFIDDKVFLDEDTFYNRYHKKNYSELASRVKPYCFRTTRPQVATHVKIPERIPIVASYTFSKDEKELYEKLKRYLKKPYKIAYQKMDTFKLNLRLFNSFTSSSYAIKDALDKAMVRIKNEEQTE